MGFTLGWVGRRLARFLARTTHVHGIGPLTKQDRLLACLQPGDVLLVEGNSRVSTAIKYLTQSTWSHAALYVGAHLDDAGGDPDHCFIEADIVDGVRSIGVNEFAGAHTRICRPVGLNESDCRRVTAFAIARLGNQYDLRNVIDLARFLFAHTAHSLAVSPPHARARQRRPKSCHLLHADRTGVSVDSLPHLTHHGHAQCGPSGLPRLYRGNSPRASPQPVRAA